MNFFKSLITDGTGTSSKRFISVLGMFLFIVIVVMSFFGINVPEVLILSLVGIIIGQSALTLGQKSNNENEKK